MGGPVHPVYDGSTERFEYDAILLSGADLTATGCGTDIAQISITGPVGVWSSRQKSELDIQMCTGGVASRESASTAYRDGTPSILQAGANMGGGLKRIAILGVPIDNLSMDETIEALDKLIETDGFHQIATANIDFLMKAIGDDELMDILQRCDLVLPDGMPLVWASRIMGTPLKERVAGSDLLPRLAELSQRKGRRLFLLGATEERSRDAAAWIMRNYPGAQIAGRFSPPFGSIDDMDHGSILRMIEESDADILLVAFGNPKQEKWLAMHRSRLHVPVCIGVGASLDFLSGTHTRAPEWMQKSGLEWMHRFYKEPGRLGGRYTRNAMGILRHLSLQMLAVSTQPRTSALSRISVFQENQALVITLVGRFTGEVVEEFDQALEKLEDLDSPMILDLNLTTSIGADAMGFLVDLSSKMRDRNQDIWLVGMRPSLRRLFRTAFLQERLFRLAPKVADALRRIDSKAPAAEPRSTTRPFLKEEVGR
ncbi:N-acetylglucosaminyldiphosphoundecaprenol N-acetyl-beta-D-mannosaminyltransferase [Granulicella aggregans]|uniref:N-acetylglucosaminyldiphosphoundecaprenol N-acetyl-beta-D-mannosaminyltransferase n=1 Tax=Granulicella aggregans TaxID=474949 RepID=A0A7W7ZAZ7_9BACT|nr:WecB/TagA/CpsF family glycosyltransferase [Granulicella aggregans]MBB5056550.1 N-acetylglucosaminyldiphosphoundecaprenol N-acetyl-beta-D-mannosaminyltransferase [Granulicella aggregans]